MFHTDSNYEYNVIIIVLAEEFEGQFKVLGVNTEKYVTFSVPVQKEIENDKKKKNSMQDKNYLQRKIYGKFTINSC